MTIRNHKQIERQKGIKNRNKDNKESQTDRKTKRNQKQK